MAIGVIMAWSWHGGDRHGFWIGLDRWRLEIEVAWIWIDGLCGSWVRW